MTFFVWLVVVMMWQHGVGVVVTVVAIGGGGYVVVTWQNDTNKSKHIKKNV